MAMKYEFMFFFQIAMASPLFSRQTLECIYPMQNSDPENRNHYQLLDYFSFK